METTVTVGQVQNAIEEATGLEAELNLLGTRIAASDPRSLALDAARTHLDGLGRSLRELQRFAVDAGDYFASQR